MLARLCLADTIDNSQPIVIIAPVDRHSEKLMTFQRLLSNIKILENQNFLLAVSKLSDKMLPRRTKEILNEYQQTWLTKIASHYVMYSHLDRD